MCGSNTHKKKRAAEFAVKLVGPIHKLKVIILI